MAQERQRMVTLIYGARGHGKTTWLRKTLDRYRGNVLVYKEGVNLYDEAFKGWKIEKFAEYKGGKAIIDGAEIPYKRFMQAVVKHYRNGALVIDDAKMYEGDEPTKELNDLVIICRRLGVDIFLVFHGFTVFPLRLTSYINYIVMFHTTDSIEYKRNKLPEYERLKAAKDRIARKVLTNKYYHEAIKLS